VLAAIAVLAAASGLLPPVDADDPVSSLVRYNREIVRIFERKCVGCHARGGLSLPLETYQDVRPWARAIREEILERRMPPWPAVNGVRPLANDISLTTREIAIITSWLDGGTPRGDPADLPPQHEHRAWVSGEPDLKLSLPQQSVPGDSSIARRITVPTGLRAQQWLRGFDIDPGERRALRSVFLFLKEANGKERWLGGWTPWHSMTHTAFEATYRLPANAVLAVELHYKTWTESKETLSDTSMLGLYFQRNRSATVLEDHTVTALPPATDQQPPRLRGELRLSRDIVVWALRPRLADNRGNTVQGSIEVRAIKPDGAIEPLLWLKENSEDWQLPYLLRDPLQLQRGSRLVLTAYPSTLEDKPSAVVSILGYPVP
jgi:hypothetical protein